MNKPTPARKHKLDFEPGGGEGGHGVLYPSGKVVTGPSRMAVPKGARAFSIDPDGNVSGELTAQQRGLVIAADSRLKMGGWKIPRGRARFEDKTKDHHRSSDEREQVVKHADPEWVTDRDEALSKLQRQRAEAERELILQRGRFAALMENRHKRGSETRTRPAARAGLYTPDGRFVDDNLMDDVADDIVYLDMGDAADSANRAMSTPDVGRGYTGRSLLEGDLREHGPRTTQLKNERAMGVAHLARLFLRHAIAGPDGQALNRAAAMRVAEDQGNDWVVVRVGSMTGAKPRTSTLKHKNEDFTFDPDEGGYVAMPEGMAKFWQAQMDEPGRALAAGEAATRAFVRAALPLAASWHAGNVVDLMTRLAVNGVHISDPKHADVFREQLSDLDGDLARRIMDSVVGVHSGSRDTVEKRGIRDVVHSGREKRPERDREVVADARAVKEGRATRVGERLHDATAFPRGLYDSTIGKLADKGFNIGGDVEQRLVRSAQGVALRKLADDLGLAIEDSQQIAKRMKHDPELVHDFQRRVLEITGDYLTRGPRDRKWLHVFTPFFQWIKASNKFVWKTLPANHPVKTALFLQASRATEEERRLLGMSDWITDEEARRFGYPEKQDAFFDGALTAGDGWLVPTGFLTSFGTAAQFADDPIDAMSGQTLPQVSKPIGAALGMNGGAVKGATRRVRRILGEDDAMAGQNTRPDAVKTVRATLSARVPGVKQAWEVADPSGDFGDIGMRAHAEKSGRLPQNEIEQAIAAATGLGRKLPNGNDDENRTKAVGNFRNIDTGGGRPMMVNLETGEFIGADTAQAKGQFKADPISKQEIRREQRISPTVRGRRRVRRLTKDHR